MGEIFTQRRILGLLILALASLVTGGWLRTIANSRIPQYAKDPEWSKPYTYDYEVTCIPLTLVSAYLVIVKARKRKQKKLVEPISDNEARRTLHTRLPKYGGRNVICGDTVRHKHGDQDVTLRSIATRRENA